METEKKRLNLPLDISLELLSNEHRRRLVTNLRCQTRCGHNGNIPIENLMNTEEWKKWELELLHVHLPKLAEAKVIRWDTNESTIGEGPQFQTIWKLLRLINTVTEESAN